MRRTFFLWVGALAALLMVAAACGGGGDNGSATSTAAARTTATAAAPTTAVATSPAGTSVSKAELANHLTTIKAVMQETIAKAQAGDVEGTRDAEGKGDEAIEAIIKAVRPVDASLADSIEKLELDYEAQADSSNPDLAVIAKDAQDVLPLLDQAASKLGITP
jgi:predicted PP-loop superfamily ATPase